MRWKASKLIVGFTVFILTFQAALAEEQGYTAASVDMLWTERADIASRNLVYGSAGDQGQVRGTMTFIAKDSQGTNPKFEVRDQDGTKWKAKLGVEARPETVPARLLWAVGYFTDQTSILTPTRQK
jgi:hypothetical protein